MLPGHGGELCREHDCEGHWSRCQIVPDMYDAVAAQLTLPFQSLLPLSKSTLVLHVTQRLILCDTMTPTPLLPVCLQSNIISCHLLQVTDRMSAQRLVIIAPKEWEAGTVRVKHLASREEENVSLETLTSQHLHS